MLVITAVIVLLGVFLFFNKDNQEVIYGEVEPTYVTAENFPAYLSSYKIIHELPNDAKINLIVGEHTFNIEDGKISQGEITNADITLSLPEKYFNMEWEGFCQTIKKALDNGDIKIEASLSNTKLLWKYKSMYKYRECIGL